MGKVTRFYIVGQPKTAGSKVSFPHSKTGKIVTIDSSKKKGKFWRQDIRTAALKHYAGIPLSEPITLLIDFYMPRPKYHYGTGKNANKLKESAPKYHSKRPDATKLLRAVEDALTGILWRDDAQIIHQVVRKFYTSDEHPVPGALIHMEVTND